MEELYTMCFGGVCEAEDVREFSTTFQHILSLCFILVAECVFLIDELCLPAGIAHYD